MTEHHALRRARGPRRVHEAGNLFRPIGDHRLGLRLLVEWADADREGADRAGLCTNSLGVSGRLLRQAHIQQQPARAAVLGDQVELARRQPRIGGDAPSVQLAGRKQQRPQHHAVLARDHDAVARPHAEAPEVICRGIHRIGEFAVAPHATAFDESGMVRHFLHEARVDFVHPRRLFAQKIVLAEHIGPHLHLSLPRNRAVRPCLLLTGYAAPNQDAAPARNAGRPRLCARISSSTSRSWSLPKNISSLTKKVGEPNAPRLTASSVSCISRLFTSGSCPFAAILAASMPDALSAAIITSGSSIFLGSSHMCR